jgi:hypothetical protein
MFYVIHYISIYLHTLNCSKYICQMNILSAYFKKPGRSSECDQETKDKVCPSRAHTQCPTSSKWATNSNSHFSYAVMKWINPLMRSAPLWPNHLSTEPKARHQSFNTRDFGDILSHLRYLKIIPFTLTSNCPLISHLPAVKFYWFFNCIFLISLFSFPISSLLSAYLTNGLV